MNAKWFVEEVIKSRLAATLIGMLAAFLATKIGLPADQTTPLLTSLVSLTGAYVLGKSHSDAAEAKAEASKPATP